MGFTFNHEAEGRSLTLKVSSEATWPELSEEFFSFMQGCGYVLSVEDFAEYWSQHLPQSQGCENQCEDCSCGVGEKVFGDVVTDLSRLYNSTITVRAR